MTRESESFGRAVDEFLAQEMRKLTETSDLYTITHTVQVTSFGGSGTTVLCRHLLDGGVDLQSGPAQWPFKHQRQPPRGDEVPEGFRVIYPVSDPRDAVLSVFRRNLQVGHYRSLHEKQPDAEALQRLDTLETFLAGDADEFGLADHFEGWLDHPAGYPVLFLRYDRLGDVWSEVCTFVGLAPDHPLLPVRARKSDWRSSPPPVRERLDALFGDLAARIDALPPTHLV